MDKGPSDPDRLLSMQLPCWYGFESPSGRHGHHQHLLVEFQVDQSTSLGISVLNLPLRHLVRMGTGQNCLSSRKLVLRPWQIILESTEVSITRPKYLILGSLRNQGQGSPLDILMCCSASTGYNPFCRGTSCPGPLEAPCPNAGGVLWLVIYSHIQPPEAYRGRHHSGKWLR